MNTINLDCTSKHGRNVDDYYNAGVDCDCVPDAEEVEN